MLFLFAAFVVPQILTEICSDDITPSLHLENQQALVKQFSEIIEFVLKFDEYKVCILSLTAFRRKTLLKVVWAISLFSNFRCELQQFKTTLAIIDECWCVKAHQCIRSRTKMKILTATWTLLTKCPCSTQKQRQCWEHCQTLLHNFWTK